MLLLLLPGCGRRNARLHGRQERAVSQCFFSLKREVVIRVLSCNPEERQAVAIRQMLGVRMSQ